MIIRPLPRQEPARAGLPRIGPIFIHIFSLSHSMTTRADTDPSPACAPASLECDGVLRLTHWGVIRARGADATKFLQGQLTNDFGLLGLSQARLAGYCSPKGRMLASFVGFKLAHDDVLLACHRDLLPTTLKRLSMFVMRAQCKLSDATDVFDVYGLAGSTADQWASTVQLGPATWDKAALPAATASTKSTPGSDTPPGALVRLPSAGAGAQATTRLLACVPAAASLPLPLSTTQPALGAGQWDWLEVQSGVAMVGLPLVEAFVPQMLNYESVGGVNFKKGCYPGQEVVARSQYRGTLKRRTYRVAADAPLSVGQDVFHSSDAEQPCGTVVAASSIGNAALVSMQTSAAESGTLTAGSPAGAALHLQTLPYALLADI